MKKNMGSADRIIRIVAAIVFAVLYFTGTVTGAFGIVLIVLGGIFVVTSLISFCPLYTLIGINSCRKINR
jgi:drug/metabolite transporter superfamily protein YnfA